MKNHARMAQQRIHAATIEGNERQSPRRLEQGNHLAAARRAPETHKGVFDKNDQAEEED